MKKSIILMILVAACIGTGCLSRGNTKKADSAKAEETTEVKTPDIVIPGEDGIVQFVLTDGHGQAEIRHKKGETICLVFTAEGFSTLHGELTSEDPDANIRFSQITMPDGTADGPFGQEIDYELSGDGTYKLSLNENIMAGDPWEGDFTVTIDLK